MDLTYFIQNSIGPADKSGLYCVEQKHVPPSYRAFRCGLAGRPVDTATSVKTEEGNFKARFAMYLRNGWLPTDGKVHACLTVPRRSMQGFAERVMPERVIGDNREEYARLHLGKTLIDIREKQYHQILTQMGLTRLGMPGTEVEKRRGEFFKGNLTDIVSALRRIGVGDLYIFKSNEEWSKVTLKRRNVEEITPTHVPLRKSSRFVVDKQTAERASKGDKKTVAGLASLGAIRARRRSMT